MYILEHAMNHITSEGVSKKNQHVDQIQCMHAIGVLVQFVLFEHHPQLIPILAPFGPHLMHIQRHIQTSTGFSLTQPTKLGVDALIALQPIFIGELHLRFPESDFFKGVGGRNGL